MKLSSLTLALTAYNEGDELQKTVAKALEFLPSAAEGWELLIINDGSTDSTGEKADYLDGQHEGIRAIHHEQNRGMGAAIRTAIKEANCNWFCTIAADGQVNPNDLDKLVERVSGKEESIDAVFTHYSVRRDGWDRKLLTLGMRTLTGILTGCFTLPTGNYFVKSEDVKKMKISSDTFFANYEVYFHTRKRAHADRIAWTEIPCSPRAEGNSKTRNARTIWKVFAELLRYRFRSL